MTREEQIIQESIKKYPRFPERRIGFIDGIQWADKHPNPDTIKSIFEFALNNTNFLIADSLESIDWEVLIKKAMEESL